MTNMKHFDIPLPAEGSDDNTYKYAELRRIANLYNCDYLVEFGTFQGDCALRLHEDFSKIITVEPVKYWYELSKERLKDIKNVDIRNIKGIDFINNNLNEIKNHRTLFWVDSHAAPPHNENASNDLWVEVETLFKTMTNDNYILMIDDYRLWQDYCNKNEFIKLLENNSVEVVLQWDIVTVVPATNIN
jgi:hypothetical protein